MNNTTMDQIKHLQRKLLLRLELWFAPVLIIIPILAGLTLMVDWYLRGGSTGSSLYDGEFLLGLLILIGNLLFDIPFLLLIRTLKKKQL